MNRTINPRELESQQAYKDPEYNIFKVIKEAIEGHEEKYHKPVAEEEGLCASCKEIVVPVDGFCPICEQDFNDITEGEQYEK